MCFTSNIVFATLLLFCLNVSPSRLIMTVRDERDVFSAINYMYLLFCGLCFDGCHMRLGALNRMRHLFVALLRQFYNF